MEYIGLLSHAGFIVPVAVLKARLGKLHDRFLASLVVTQAQIVGKPLVTTIYGLTTIAGTPCYILPRTYIRSLVSTGVLTRVETLYGDVANNNCELAVDLYDNQTIILDHIFANIYTHARILDGSACLLLNLRAGMGKTFVAAGLIARLRVRTLYVVPGIQLARQSAKDLRLALTGVTCAEYGDKKRRDADIVVIVINSALKLGEDVLSTFGLFILDEVQTYCTKTRRDIFRKCARISFAMTATSEDRRDGLDVIAHKELAMDGIVRAEDIPGFTYEDVNFDCTVRVINYYGRPENTRHLVHDNTGMLFATFMYNQFLQDKDRIDVAVNELIQLYDWRDGDKKHFIFVFAEELAILKVAREAFIAALIARNREDIAAEINIPEIALFTGGIKEADAKNVIAIGRVLFTTYGYSGTGTSIQHMSAMIFLTPRKSNMKQILARIMRRGSDQTIPRIVVDLVDKKTGLQKQFAERRQAYEFYNFVQEIIKIVIK